MSSRRRRIDGWGFAGESYPPSPALLRWLGERLGEGEPFPSLDPGDLGSDDPPAVGSLPDLGCAVDRDLPSRLACSRGQGLPDLLRLRSGTVPRLADAVARPADDGDLRSLLAAGDRHGLVLIPRGGGTSVTGGVNLPATEANVVVVDLALLAGLERLDPASGLATFGAGTIGPAIEAALEAEGWTLGHFPLSWELSTLGGWIATRSAGQESLGYGRIESLVAGLEAVAPAGELELPALPASDASPDLRQLVLGSEGSLGIITRATVRIRRRPEVTRVEALLPQWEGGVEAARRLMGEGVPLSLLRLSDGSETEVAMAVGFAERRLEPLVRGWLRLRGIGAGACLLLLGASGSLGGVHCTLEDARSVARRFGAVWLGERPRRKWIADRFRHPYLLDALLDVGYATETFETAAPWSGLEALYRAVQQALSKDESVPVLCHLSHPYRDGASLYIHVLLPLPAGP